MPMQFTVRVVENGFTVKRSGVDGIYIASNGYEVRTVIEDIIAKDKNLRSKLEEFDRLFEGGIPV